MKTKKLTKTGLAKQIGVTHPAIVQWQTSGKIPAEKCFIIAPIIGVNASDLWENPNILFAMFNSNNSDAKQSTTKPQKQVSA